MQRRVAGTSGKQRGAGAGNDEFTDEIDELVELLRAHAHEARFLRLVVADLALFFQRHVDHLFLHHAFLDQHLTDGRFATHRFQAVLDTQCVFQLVFGEDAGLDQQLAQHVGVAAGVFEPLDKSREMARWRKNAQLAVVTHEFENILDRLLVRLALEVERIPQVAGFRIHRRQLRQIAVVDVERDDVADGGQIADERDRLHAVFQDLAPEDDRQVPVIPLDGAAATRSQLAFVDRRHAGLTRGYAPPGRRAAARQVPHPRPPAAHRAPYRFPPRP